jgi:secretion/DNA translocation related TadE-like protein
MSPGRWRGRGRGGGRRPRPEAAGCRVRRREAGAGSVLALAAIGVLVVVLAGALPVVAAARDAHRARSAADLGALAAARGTVAGRPPDCAAAARIAAGVGAALRGCRALHDGSVVVAVGVHLRWARGWAGLPAEVGGTARAGPQGLTS